MPQKIAAGNWKMNGTQASLSEIQAIAEAAQEIAPARPFYARRPHLLHRAASLAGPLAIGGQNCHHAPSGAFTGDISAAQLADCGASYVILGHSERREGYGESDSLVRAKAQAKPSNPGSLPSSALVRAKTNAPQVRRLRSCWRSCPAPCPMMSRSSLPMSPIWAIGTGLVPSVAEITEVHDALRAQLHAIFGAALVRTSPSFMADR